MTRDKNQLKCSLHLSQKIDFEQGSTKVKCKEEIVLTSKTTRTFFVSLNQTLLILLPFQNGMSNVEKHCVQYDFYQTSIFINNYYILFLKSFLIS